MDLLAGLAGIGYGKGSFPMRFLGFIIGRLTLMVIFFLLILPVGLALRWIRMDILNLRPRPKGPEWLRRPR